MSEEQKKKKHAKPKGLDHAATIVLSDEQKQHLGRMIGMGMPLDKCALILGISRRTLFRIMDRDDEVRDTIKRSESRTFGKVFTTAYEMATNGKNPSMTMFWLKCRAKWRDVNPYDEEDNQSKEIQVNYKVDDDSE